MSTLGQACTIDRPVVPQSRWPRIDGRRSEPSSLTETPKELSGGVWDRSRREGDSEQRRQRRALKKTKTRDLWLLCSPSHAPFLLQVINTSYVIQPWLHRNATRNATATRATRSGPPSTLVTGQNIMRHSSYVDASWRRSACRVRCLRGASRGISETNKARDDVCF